MEIEELVDEVKSGNKEAYTKLINLVKDDLHRVALSRLHNEDDAQDVIQETIIKAYLNIYRLKKNKRFRSWIIKILINECNKTFKKHKRKDELTEKYTINTKTVDYINDDKLDFEKLIESLNDNEKKIFELHYRDGFTTKKIASLLNMNENSVKTTLSRGRIKLRRTLKPTSLFITILVLFIATGVAAACIISYIQSLFKVSTGSMENDGILMAIEHLDWYQDPEMDYIDLGDGYSMKVDYLLMDEMNLYMVVDLESEKDIGKFTQVYFPDLKITNENGDVICDESNVLDENYNKSATVQLIESSNHNIKFLIYMFTDSFPISRKLNIAFSEVMIAKDMNSRNSINADINFDIELADKFVNRHSTSYTSTNDKVEKAIITETGFYAIIDDYDLVNSDVRLVDNLGNSYKCYFQLFTDYDLKYIIISNFNNTDNETLKLIIDDKEYELTKN